MNSFYLIISQTSICLYHFFFVNLIHEFPRHRYPLYYQLEKINFLQIDHYFVIFDNVGIEYI
ncbi:uncharacterized protein B0P05DRAFT_552221, partial [Gilbertella persicaria]|uniref:uncharacterized protein n=1 Tax=Gilbertella persicaria TaxID=101096 RepID=UPI00221F542D